MTFAVRTELADALRGKIADGTYADMNAVIEAALMASTLDEYEREHPIDDDHIRREVHAAMEEYDRDPSTAFTIDEVRARISARRAGLGADAA